MPRGKKIFDKSLFYKYCIVGRKVFKPKGRGKRYTTQEEVADAEGKKQRDKEWRVRSDCNNNRQLVIYTA